MTLEEFLDEWHRQANEYGASLTQDQRDIAEQAWLIATQKEREACAEIADEYEYQLVAGSCAKDIRARGKS